MKEALSLQLLPGNQLIPIFETCLELNALIRWIRDSLWIIQDHLRALEEPPVAVLLLSAPVDELAQQQRGIGGTRDEAQPWVVGHGASGIGNTI
jgi:hypothetical protein